VKPSISRNWLTLEGFEADQGPRKLGKLRRRKPRKIPKTPNMTAYHAIIQIRAAAPASGFQRSKTAKAMDSRPIRMRNHSPLTSRRSLIAAAISVF
jgi:hypothetical protein